MIRYCPESHTIFDGEVDLTKCGGYTFNFSTKGLFTLLNRKEEPLYEIALPLFNKVCSHLLWMMLWIFLIALTNFFGPTYYLKTSNPLFMSLIFFHLFFFGIRLTSLLVAGGIQAIFSPPLWVHITKQFQRGEGFALLEKHQLQRHPGLLANLALSKALQGDYKTAKDAINQALDLCPKHPALQALYHHLAQHSFTLTSNS